MLQINEYVIYKKKSRDPNYMNNGGVCLWKLTVHLSEKKKRHMYVLLYGNNGVLSYLTFEIVLVVRVEGLLEVTVFGERRTRLERLDQLVPFRQVFALRTLTSYT